MEEAVIMRGKSSAAKKYSVGSHFHRTAGKRRVQAEARAGGGAGAQEHQRSNDQSGKGFRESKLLVVVNS